MAQELGAHPLLIVHFLLKRKQDKHFIHRSADILDPTLTPGPNLGADEEKDSASMFSALPRQAKVQCRIIDKDDGIVLSAANFTSKYAVHVPVVGKIAQYLNDSDRAHAANIKERLHPLPTHAFAAQSGKPTVGLEYFQGMDEPAPVQIPGSLSSNNQKPIRLIAHLIFAGSTKKKEMFPTSSI
jgi:hypothetical protein